MDEVATRLRAGGGLLTRAENRDISGRIDRLVRVGQLAILMPGVYGLPGSLEDPAVFARAALVWAGPNAVLTGLAAARLTYWPTAPLRTVTVALPITTKRSRGRVKVERRRIPPELVVCERRIAVTHPALTAVDLASTEHGGMAIDEALRTGAATLDQMWEAFALQPGRPGNPQRKHLLHDSRDCPWSEAERTTHQLLRRAGITGWKTNRRVAGYRVDVLFRRLRLIVEIDGFQTHGGRQAFEDDRRRRNALVLAGYTVLNFTWRQLQDDPDWVISCIRSAIVR